MIQYCPTSIILRLDSTFPAEGPKDGVTQLCKETYSRQDFLSLVAQF